MELVNIEIENLKPLTNNVRKHGEKQINEMIRSVEQFGQTRAIVVDEDYNILIGNALYEALRRMGKKSAQCFIKKGLNETEKKKLILTDNKVYQLGIDDYDNINNYINEIVGSGDLDIAGFDAETLKLMTITDEESEELLKDYGNITDVKLTEVKEPVKEETPVQTTKTQEIKVGEENKTFSTEVKQERKYIVCPSCGEVIYLD